MPASITELDTLLQELERSSSARSAGDAIRSLRAFAPIITDLSLAAGPAAQRLRDALSALRLTLEELDPAPSDTQIEWLYNDATSLVEVFTDMTGGLDSADLQVAAARRAGEAIASAFERWRAWVETEYDSILSPIVNRNHARLPQREDRLPRLYLVSGPSAAGKDAIIGEVIPRLLAVGIRADCLTKYSTRELRPPEQPNAIAESIPWRLEYQRRLEMNEFDKRVSEGRLIISYSKYSNKYAFDAGSIGQSLEDPVRFCIFSEFTRLEYAIARFEERGVVVVPILVLAKPEILEPRMFRRGLDIEDARRRIAEMKADYKYINGNKKKIRATYPLIVWNQHPATFEDAVNKVFHFIIQTLPGENADG